MLDILTNIKSGIIITALAAASLFGWTPQVQPPSNLGASFVTPEVKALFTTSLASKITSTATSMTLVSATDKDGTTLASSTYGFIIDEGTSVEEFVLADCTGTTCTNMTRGISVSTATTSVSALQFEHRRGASVKITTAPSLVFVMNVLKGKQNMENVLKYSSSVATTTIDDDNRNLVNYEMLTYTAFNGAGVINASATQKGLVEIATTLEAASSSATGSTGATLVIPASSATSTYNSATAPLRVVVTGNTGKIDNNFIATSTLFNNGLTISGTSNIASTSIRVYAATTTDHSATSTWSKPSNLKYVKVRLIGGGGGAYGAQQSGSHLSPGGGSSTYCEKYVPASAIPSTVVITAGKAGSGQPYTGSSNDLRNGGYSTFSGFATSTGGTGATDTSTGFGQAGTATGCDFSVAGEDGSYAVSNVVATGSSGNGADSALGHGGNPVRPDSSGRTGTGYGAGGGGAASDTSSASDYSGGNGSPGVVIIEEIYY